MAISKVFSRRAFISAMVVGLVVPVAAMADDDDDWDDDHDRAFRHRGKREIKPLHEIVDGLKSELPPNTEIIAMELEREDGVWVYEFKVIDNTGRRYEVCVDAKTGQFLGEENKDHACSSGRGRSTDRRGRKPRPFGSRLYRGDDD